MLGLYFLVLVECRFKVRSRGNFRFKILHKNLYLQQIQILLGQLLSIEATVYINGMCDSYWSQLYILQGNSHVLCTLVSDKNKP
jgi:hypothetical protein